MSNFNMKEKVVENLKSILSKWDEIIVRMVPGVMYQVLCGVDDMDTNIEYRIHWFLDCTETYIHNHRYTFDTYCLEGEYKETLWKIDDGDKSQTTFQFSRTSGNKFGSIKRISGVLQPIKDRHHFPGNILHVDTDQFHSISPIESDKKVLTFVAQNRTSSSAASSYILSPTDVIDAPTDEIRSTTPEERQAMYQKLQQIYQQISGNHDLRKKTSKMVDKQLSKLYKTKLR